MNEAHGVWQEPAYGGAPLREISLEELEFIHESHKKWLESNREEGDRADLSGVDLRGADLGNFDLQGALLIGTDLRNADLRDARLSDAKGLLPDSLAGADLSNAKLPEDIAKFQGLAQAREIATNAQKIFIAMLLGCAYSVLTIATTTDARLLTNSASSPLPIIGTPIPIAWFYWVAPLILLGFYIYFHLYLQNMWQALAVLPARFPDGKALDERVDPWLLNGIVRAHFVRFRKEPRPPLSRLQVGLSIFLAWWVVPGTLLLFWLRYLPRHHWGGTIVQIVFLLVAIWTGITFYRLARATLRQDSGDAVVTSPNLESVAAAIAALSLTAFADVAISARPPFDRVGYPNADLVEADVSVRPAGWTGDDETQFALVQGARLKGRNLRFTQAQGAFLVRADLRDADLQGAVLSGADLRKALLGPDRSTPDVRGATRQGGSLLRTDFQGTDVRTVRITTLVGPISGANLQKANLFGADLQEANLAFANLQRAYLWGANLQKAVLRRANLQGAHLIHGDFSGADLSFANFKDARFTPDLESFRTRGAMPRVQFQRADLTGARGLTQDQLDGACGDETTKLPEGLTIKPCPQDAEKDVEQPTQLAD